MAKVKGFNPPETKLLYEEKGGILHYFGEFLRMILGEGYMAPGDPETDIIGQTKRGDRPTQQGDLTGRRKFVRKAFQGCINLWALMPEECPFFEEDPPKPAKETVWQAKLDHGVVCSYFDLWMRCCMKHAMAHDGAMPVSECFPCVAECIEDPDMAWDYSVSDEEIDREGSATIAITGENTPFSWSVSGNGFSLENETTVGVTNTLFADETACGTAIITVTGCDNQLVIGEVRCTFGNWILKQSWAIGEPGLVFTGAATGYTEGNKPYIIRGKGKYVEGKNRGSICSPYYEPCNEGCPPHGITEYDCGRCGCWGTCTGMSFFDGCCCGHLSMDPCRYYKMYVGSSYYYEWEC